MQTILKDRTERVLIHSADQELAAHEFFVGSYNGWLIAVQSVSVEYYTDFAPTYHDKPIYQVRVEINGTKVNKNGRLGEQTLSAKIYASSTDRTRTDAATWLINLIVSHKPGWWNGDLGGMYLRKPLEKHDTTHGSYFVWMKP